MVSSSIRSGMSLTAAPRGGFPECRQWRLQLHEGDDHLLHLASLQRAPEKQGADAVGPPPPASVSVDPCVVACNWCIGQGGVKGRRQPKSTGGTIAGAPDGEDQQIEWRKGIEGEMRLERSTRRPLS